MADIKGITDFYKVATERDFSRDFQFRILSISPGDLSNISVSEDDLIYAHGGAMPGRSITNTDVPFMGLNFKVPGGATYGGEYGITFYSDREDKLRQLFLEWSHDIFDDATSTGMYMTPGRQSQIDLVQLDTQLNAIAKYSLHGCFPTSVGDITYNIQGAGAPVQFEVTLAYHFWRKTG
jgi:hypothetical protein